MDQLPVEIKIDDYCNPQLHALLVLNKNQKWDPLRAMKTFIRRKVGHTT